MIQLPDFSPKHAAPKKELKAFILKKRIHNVYSYYKAYLQYHLC